MRIMKNGKKIKKKLKKVKNNENKKKNKKNNRKIELFIKIHHSIVCIIISRHICLTSLLFNNKG